MRRARLRVAGALLAALLWAAAATAGTEYHITIPTTLGDTTETFWLQIPAGYQPGVPRPLLIGWHQLHADEWELKEATDFPQIADRRGWIAACHRGPSQSHWNNHAAQSHLVDVVRWIEERYAVDTDRIYMVGSSMGGAAGMVFSNNHLDPDGVMVAAAASVSGIQDCERRFHEQGYNNSMAEAFGGTPEEVPFVYHRNSAIVFADSVESMHRNAARLPLWLTFGSGVSDSIWRAHAEDLYEAMQGIAGTIVLRESSRAGHGWVCAEEDAICEFMSGFTVDRHPASIAVNADDEGRWYWCNLRARRVSNRFARFDGAVDPGQARVAVAFVANVAAADIALAPLGFPLDGRPIAIGWEIRDNGMAELGIAGVPRAPSVILRDGVPFGGWSYDPLGGGRLLLLSQGSATYLVHFDTASIAGNDGDPDAIRLWFSGGELHIAASRSEALRWFLSDGGGRRLAGGVAAPPYGAIHLPSRIPRGVYFVTVAGEGGRVPAVLRRKIFLSSRR